LSTLGEVSLLSLKKKSLFIKRRGRTICGKKRAKKGSPQRKSDLGEKKGNPQEERVFYLYNEGAKQYREEQRAFNAQREGKGGDVG